MYFKTRTALAESDPPGLCKAQRLQITALANRFAKRFATQYNSKAHRFSTISSNLCSRYTRASTHKPEYTFPVTFKFSNLMLLNRGAFDTRQ